MKKILLLLGIMAWLFPSMLLGQKITVDPEDYKQEFQGTGASCGLYIGHYLSMKEENRMKASQMLYEDLKLTHIKNYTRRRPTDEGGAEKYDKISTAFTNAKKFCPDLKIMICVNNLPDELEVGYGTDAHKDHEHDPNIPDIFDKIAEYYFLVCKGYHDRGHTVDILELVNERGYSDGKVTDLYDIAADKFKVLINDPNYNTTGVPMPKIAGPATWSAASPKTFINGWKADRPNAWANVDIVTTHAYENGTEANLKETYKLSEGKPFYNSEQTGKLQTDEEKGVDLIAEQFPEASYYPNFVSNATMARHMTNLFNAGGNAFYCFLTNTHKAFHNAGLIATKWGGEPVENNIYYGFKHLSATHPLFSHRVSQELTDMEGVEAVAFRKKGEDVVYVHITNLYDTYKQITINFKDKGISAAQVIRTDEFSNFEEKSNKTFGEALGELSLAITPYSVNTVKVTLSKGATTKKFENQTITFADIEEQQEHALSFPLEASSSSGLPVELTVLSGPAFIKDGRLKVNGVGTVRVLATQIGNEQFNEAVPVIKTFRVLPTGENVALNKPATASSIYNSKYTADKAVDGEKIKDESRWLTAKNIEFTEKKPQWIEIDLQEARTIHALRLYGGVNEKYNKPIYEFEFQAWLKGKWQTVLQETDNYSAEYLGQFPEVRTEKVRLLLEGAPDKFIARLYEMEVFEPAPKPVLSTDDSELSHGEELSVYPNPVQETLFIKGIQETDVVNISTLSGKTLHSEKYNQGINVDFLEEGMYIVSVNGAGVTKFIKK